MREFKFIEKPDLPQNRVCHAVVSPHFENVIKALERNCVHCLTVSACERLLDGLEYHADMVFRHLGAEHYAAEASQSQLKKKLNSIGGKQMGEDIVAEKNYPYDIPLNFFELGNRMFCNSVFTPDSLKRDKQVIGVKQGYAKCSAIVVDENSVVTDDISVFRAATGAGVDALLIEKSRIILPGFDNGFIGGCCGKLSRDTLAFCGDISRHVSFAQLDSFLRQRGVYIYSLFGGELLDIGSVLPVTEYV